MGDVVVFGFDFFCELFYLVDEFGLVDVVVLEGEENGVDEGGGYDD